MARIWDEPKDPDEEFDYAINWAKWLAQWNDTIVTSDWELPAGIVGGAQFHTATTTTKWFDGGTNGVDYPIKNTITTAGGRIGEVTGILRVRTK